MRLLRCFTVRVGRSGSGGRSGPSSLRANRGRREKVRGSGARAGLQGRDHSYRPAVPDGAEPRGPQPGAAPSGRRRQLHRCRRGQAGTRFHAQGHPGFRPGRLRAAALRGRGGALVDPRLGPPAHLPWPGPAAPPGRRAPQSRRRRLRLPGRGAPGRPLRRGPPGQQRPRARRVHPGRCHQLRLPERPRGEPGAGALRRGSLRLPPRSGQLGRRPRARSTTSPRSPTSPRTASGITASKAISGSSATSAAASTRTARPAST